MRAARQAPLTPARLIAAALVVALPLFAGHLAGHLFDWEIITCALVVAACAVATCVGLLLTGRVPGPRLGAVEWLLMGFLAWLVVASIRSVYLHASLVAVLQMAGYVAFMALWSRLFGSERMRPWGWATVVVGGALAGFMGLRDWTHTVIFQGDTSWRAFGTFYNPNCLAGYSLVALAAAGVVLTRAWRSTTDPERPPRPRYELIFAGFALLLPACALLLTASRAGILGAGVGVLVLLAALPGRVPRRWLVAGVLGVVLLVGAVPPLRTRLLQAATQSHSAVFRWYTWQGTVRVIAARPLTGFGPGTFEHAYQPHALTGFTRMAHQTPLQVAAEAGLPAIVLLLAALALIGRELAGGCRRGGMRGVESAAGLAAMAALGLQNLADYTWYVPAVGLTLAAVLAMARAAARGEDPDQAEQPTRSGGAACWVGIGLAVLVATVCLVGLRAEDLAGRGKAALARGSFHVARGWLSQAVRVDPLDAETWGDLSQALAGSGSEGSLQAAVQARRRAIELCPMKSGHHLMLALLLDAAGDEEAAIEVARRSVELGRNHPRAYANLARLLAKAGREDEALEVYRRLEEVYRSPVGKYQALTQLSDYAYAEAWIALGREALTAGEAARAIRYFEDAVELTGRYAEELRAQEKLLRQIGGWDEMRVLEAERIQAVANLLLADARRSLEGD